MRGVISAVGLFAAVALLLVGMARPVGAAQDDDSVTVEMEEYDGSGISGTAVLTDSPDGVIVDITLEGNLVGAHPSHFHEGDCSTMDPLVPIYPLADIGADGKSVTTVPDITLAEITSVPFVINVHESLAALPVIVSCGNVPVLTQGVGGETEDGGDVATPVPDGVGGGSADEIPQAGVGSALAAGGADSTALVVLGALAVVLAVAGVALRRAEDRSGVA